MFAKLCGEGGRFVNGTLAAFGGGGELEEVDEWGIVESLPLV